MSARPATLPLRAVQSDDFARALEIRVLGEFHRAAADVPAYRTLLDEEGVRAGDVRDLASFSRLCPLLSKRNTFDRFPLDQLSAGGRLLDVADVLTSSGHGGRFSFGVINRKQASSAAQFIDEAFDEAFGIMARKTLTINCLPMGVGFSSHRMTVATTSVREDMALALVEAFAHFYDQLVLVGDPLFMKKLTDHAQEHGVDWSRYRVNAIIGEEVFGEHFRGYLAACLGLNVGRPDGGYVMSSFGVGELGLHLCYEIPATIGLRRATLDNSAFARDLLGGGDGDGGAPPMIFTFNPLRTFIEVVGRDTNGYGSLTISMLDSERSVPLLRYQTGDTVRLLDRAQAATAMRRHNVSLSGELPAVLLALKGREKDALPNGFHVSAYKDTLYADHRIARRLTGAFRLSFSGDVSTMHVQLRGSESPDALLEREILHTMAPRLRPTRLKLWRYAGFPFGMGLDYERKFPHYVHGADDPIGLM